MEQLINKDKLPERIKRNKKNIYIALGMLIFTLIICSNFLKVHFAQDTYCVYYDGWNQYIKVFLTSSRIFSALLLGIAKIFHFSLETTIIISSILTILFFTMAWYILYRYTIKLIKKDNNIYDNLLVIGISFLIVFNFCTFELTVFIESGMMALSVLLSVISACLFSSRKYVKSFILLILASWGYQSSIGLFVLITLVFIAYKDKDNLKNILKKAICVFIFWGVIMLLNLLVSKGFAIFFKVTQRQTTMLNFSEIINTVVKYVKFILIDNIDVGFKYWYLSVIVIISILFIVLFTKNRKYFNIFEYVILILVSILIPIAPILTMPISSQYMVPRMCITFGSILGILLLYLFIIMKPNNVKIVEKIVTILVIVLFVVNSIYFIRGSSENIATGYLDKNVAGSILNQINKYERESGIKIKNIGIMFDSECTTYYNSQPSMGSATVRSMITDWAVIPALEYYGQVKYNMVYDIPEEIKSEFSAKSWDYYSDEQLVFDGDTLYLCLF
mgnify:CR=1 FL=1